MKQRRDAKSAVDHAAETQANVLANLRKLLETGKNEEALDLLGHRAMNDPELRNALGVCQMRLGNHEAAVVVLRGLATGTSGIMLRPDAPLKYKVNFATALLLAGQTRGCLDVLGEIGEESDPEVVRLRTMIKNWKKSLGFFGRLRWMSGDSIDAKVTFDGPPGEL